MLPGTNDPGAVLELWKRGASIVPLRADEPKRAACTREKQRRKDLRSEIERRITAEGYKMGDIFPELRSGGTNGTRRRKLPVKFRNPQNPDETWTGIGRPPKWVQAILAERGIDMAAFKGIPMYQVHA